MAVLSARVLLFLSVLLLSPHVCVGKRVDLDLIVATSVMEPWVQMPSRMDAAPTMCTKLPRSAVTFPLLEHLSKGRSGVGNTTADRGPEASFSGKLGEKHVSCLVTFKHILLCPTSEAAYNAVERGDAQLALPLKSGVMSSYVQNASTSSPAKNLWIATTPLAVLFIPDQLVRSTVRRPCGGVLRFAPIWTHLH